MKTKKEPEYSNNIFAYSKTVLPIKKAFETIQIPLKLKPEIISFNTRQEIKTLFHDSAGLFTTPNVFYQEFCPWLSIICRLDFGDFRGRRSRLSKKTKHLLFLSDSDHTNIAKSWF